MGTLKQKAYNHIRGRILRGELSPGARLSNRKLAAEVGISFIPVREAIGQLVSEGLAEHRPNYGAVVREASREEIVDLYDFRHALECHAVKAAAKYVTAADISELEDRNRRLINAAVRITSSFGSGSVVCSDQFAIQDAAFHMVMLRAAGNSLVMKTIGDLQIMERVFSFRTTNLNKKRLDRVCSEHKRIIMCLRNGDADGAELAMAQHLDHGKQVAVAAFDRDRASNAAQRAFAGQLELQIQSL